LGFGRGGGGGTEVFWRISTSPDLVNIMRSKVRKEGGYANGDGGVKGPASGVLSDKETPQKGSDR